MRIAPIEQLRDAAKSAVLEVIDGDFSPENIELLHFVQFEATRDELLSVLDDNEIDDEEGL